MQVLACFNTLCLMLQASSGISHRNTKKTLSYSSLHMCSMAGKDKERDSFLALPETHFCKGVVGMFGLLMSMMFCS